MAHAARRQRQLINDSLVLGVLIGLFMGAVGASLYFHFQTGEPELASWADGFSQNFGTEMFGAFLTFYLIEVLLRKRREADSKAALDKERLDELTLQMGSDDNILAREAVRVLNLKGWLTDGSLREAVLRRANLQAAQLKEADLRRAALEDANLQEANLELVDLQGAALWGANLKAANLERAKLREAILRHADLQGANLHDADLRETTLHEANLRNADLVGVDLRNSTPWQVDLQDSSLTFVNFHGAKGMTVEQLRSAGSLKHATMPDGTQLREPWRESFEVWAGTIETDEWDYIVPVAWDGSEDVAEPISFGSSQLEFQQSFALRSDQQKPD